MGGGQQQRLGHKKTTNASLQAPPLCYVLGRASMSGTSPPSSFTPERLRLGRERERKKGAEENDVDMIHVSSGIVFPARHPLHQQG